LKEYYISMIIVCFSMP